MKNLPEKIYLNFGDLTEEEYNETDFHDLFSEEVTWSENDVQGRNLEYVRKDAFIEKVRKFMEKIDNVDEYTWYNEEEHAVGITEKCIEDFKKYIKGQ